MSLSDGKIVEKKVKFDLKVDKSINYFSYIVNKFIGKLSILLKF